MSIWVFTYGALMFKPNFPYINLEVGHVNGFQRRFYQASREHRGTPENPGRIVTVVPATPQDRVYGIAFKVATDDIYEVQKYLEARQRGDYTKLNTMFTPRIGEFAPFEVVLYIAHANNKNYAGEADEDYIANQIVKAKGTSGTNIDYICRLARSMRTFAPEVCDQHLFNIEKKVLELAESASAP